MDRVDESKRGLSWEGRRTPLTSPAVGAAFIAVIGVAILRVARGRPDWIRSWHVAGAFLLFAMFLVVNEHGMGRSLRRVRDDDDVLVYVLATIQLVLLFVLYLVVFQSRNPGFGLGIDRSVELAAIFLGLLATGVLAAYPRRFSAGQWFFFACFAIVAGILFHHSIGVAEASARARHPLWWSLLAGVNLFVVPRYLSSDQYLWTLNRLAAGFVLLALPIYVVGEYSLFGLQVTFHSSYEIPLLGREVRATRSLFVNRNTFSEVVFVGVIAGVAEAHRAIRRGGRVQLLGVPSQLLALNVLGLALAYDRAMWVITPAAAGIYLAYVTFGRQSIPLAVTAAIAALVGGLLAVYLGLLDTHTSNRFALWRAGIAAIADQPSLLGEGLIPAGRFMADYHDLGSISPHNSYISIWIRTGVLGGLAYGLLVAGSVVWGALRYRDVDVAALCLAAGFAAHQLFEAYTLFQSGIGSVLATLTLGFLIFGSGDADWQWAAATAGSDADTGSDEPPRSGAADRSGEANQPGEGSTTSSEQTADYI